MAWLWPIASILICFVRQLEGGYNYHGLDYKPVNATLDLPYEMPVPAHFRDTLLEDIIINLGLICERYNVTTEDGYIINLNRIVNPQLKDQRQKGVPVLLINGLFMHADSWFLQQRPVDNPPLAWLARGYDVWVGDPRGTSRSRSHIKYSPEERAFWDFTFHETGVYDVPAFMDFILNETSQEKMVYAGMSLGGANFFALCSERPEYQKKLIGAILYAPVGEVPQLESIQWPVRVTLSTLYTLMQAGMEVGLDYIREIPLVRTTANLFCKPLSWYVILSFHITLGPNGHFDPGDVCNKAPMAMGGTSFKNVLHTIQLYQKGALAKYDYGPGENLRVYGQMDPPNYDVTKVKTPTAIYYSDADPFAPTLAVEKMMRKFQGLVYGCEMKAFCHICIGLDMRFGPWQEDANQILDSMSGYADDSKLKSRRCPSILNLLNVFG